MLRVLVTVILTAMIVHLSGEASATSGPGCFRVTNVASWDVLNVRSGPSASNPVVDHLPPGKHGIISQIGPCIPSSRSLPKRWCPITHYDGDQTTSGWIKQYFVTPSDCP